MGGVWMAGCWVVFASVGTFALPGQKGGEMGGAAVGIAMIVSACLFIAGFASTWGPMVCTSLPLPSLPFPSSFHPSLPSPILPPTLFPEWVDVCICERQFTNPRSSPTGTVTAELFLTRHRATGMALTTASNWTVNFLLAFFTPFVFRAIDFRIGYMFAGCCAVGAGIGAGVVFLGLVETRGRGLEEVGG